MPGIGIGISPIFNRGGSSAPTQIGSLVDSADFYNSGNWTVLGTPGESFGANTITLNSAGPYLNFNNGIVFDGLISGRNSIDFSYIVKCNNSATNTAISCSIRNYTDNSNQYQFLFSTGATFGVGYLSLRRGGVADSDVSSIPVNNNDEFLIEFSLIDSGVQVSVTNITQSSSVYTATINYVYTEPQSSATVPQTYKLSINNLGGDWTIRDVDISTQEYNQGTRWISNSKMTNFFPNTYANRAVNIARLANPGKHIYTDGAPNEYMNGVMARIDDIKFSNDKVVVLVDNSNDLRFGNPNTVAQVTSFKSQLNALGIRVMLALTIPENTLNALTINGQLTPLFDPADIITGTYDDIVDSGNIPSPLPALIGADGIHPNNTAQSIIATALQPSIL